MVLQQTLMLLHYLIFVARPTVHQPVHTHLCWHTRWDLRQKAVFAVRETAFHSIGENIHDPVPELAS